MSKTIVRFKIMFKIITSPLSTFIIMSGLKYMYCELKRVSELRESWGVYLFYRLTEANKCTPRHSVIDFKKI